MRILPKVVLLATLFATPAVAAPVPKDKKPTAKEVLAAAEEGIPAIKDLPTRAEYTAAIAAEYALCGETEKANKLFAAAVLHFKAAKSVAFANVPRLMVEAGLPKDAVAMLTDLTKTDPAHVGYMQWATFGALASAGQLKLMDEVRSRLPADSAESSAFFAAQAYLAAGEFEQAEKAFKKVERPYNRIELLGLQVAAHHRAGKKEPAGKSLKALVEETDKAIAEETDANARTEYAVTVARAKLTLAPADKRAEVHKELLATVAKYEDPNRQGKEAATTVSDDLAAGDVKAATAAAEACGEEGWVNNANLRTATYHLERGEVKKAVAVIDGLKGPYWESIGRLRLAVVLAKEGKTDEAKKEIARAEKLVGPFGDDFRSGGNVRLGPEFARAWVAAGEVEGQMTAAEKLDEPYQRAYRLLTLAKGFRPQTREERGW